MKNILLVAVLTPAALSAQTTFAPIGAKWTYTQHHLGTLDTNLFVVECVADTVIQGRTCSKLIYTDGWNNCMPFFPALTWQGDSVLMFQPIFFSFGTLYVFGQTPGFQWETIIDYPFGTDTMRWTVIDTGTVVIDGVVLRTQEVSATASGPYATVSLTSGTMTERLGDLRYLFPWITGACDMENNGPLRCYQDPYITWLNPQLPQCELGTSIDEKDGHRSWSLQPNVIERNTSVSLRCAEPGLDWTLFDAQGRLVSSGNASVGRTAINIAQPGGYVLILSQQGKILGCERLAVY